MAHDSGADAGSERLGWAPWVVLALALSLGTWLRVQGLSQMLFFGDEFLSLCNYSLPWRQILTAYDQGGSGIPLLLMQKVSASVLGADELTLRLPALVPGLLSIPVSYLFYRLFFDPLPASLGAALFAVSHYAIYYSMLGRIYAVYLLLSLLAVILVVDALRAPSWRRGIAIGMLLALVLYSHLASAALVLALSLYVGGVLLIDRPKIATWLIWSGAACVGLTLAFLLYWPALDAVTMFLSDKAQYANGAGIDFSAVLEVFAGGRANAVAFALLMPAGLAIGLLRRSPNRWLVVSMLAASVLILVVVQPIGRPIAHARYVIFLFPFLMVPILDVLVEVAQRSSQLIGPRSRAPLTIALGCVFAVPYWASGHQGILLDRSQNIDRVRSIGIDRVDFPVPAVYSDARFERECRRVVEFPFFRLRERRSAQLLYMKYRLTHGKDVYIGEAVDTGDFRRYVNVEDLPAELRDGACLVFHKQIPLEARSWAQTFARAGDVGAGQIQNGSWPRVSRLDEVSPACWLEGGGVPYAMDRLLARLKEAHGSPWYEDELLAVFRIEPEA